ncbi:hypothetical protein K458DRAFT_413257 [Lentithecium fluviatile CBS 122367]|uniref:FAR-17a/AIG1-like protein n=1 Tax=Lentithecium fluviatile CBS 122367 TaxID=1168545 RepID=A0A6G1JIU8_9PLEO|nr:hypothetical protein K458DRAFT_413257 [Lentithecium fluviatile CBS 122367]
MPFWKRSGAREDAGFDPSFRFETSWVLPPVVLFAIRALLGLYAFVTLFTIFGWNGSHGMSVESRHSFSYFTNLTYWGLAFYYVFGALHTCSYLITGTPFLARWPRVLQVAHSMFYSTIVVYPWIVTAVYWALLAPSDGFPSIFATWSNSSQHALNAAYALFEILFPRTEPLPFLHLVPIVLLLALYLGLAYLTHATEGFYVYDFLDLDKHSDGIVAAYIVGILVGSIIVFLIVRYVIMLRVWITEKKLGKSGKFRRGTRVGDEEHGKSIPLHSMSGK